MKIKERANCWSFTLIYKSIHYISEYVELEDKFYCILNDQDMGITHIAHNEPDKFGSHWLRVAEHLLLPEVIHLSRRVNFLPHNELLYVVTATQGEEAMVFEVKVEVI